MAPSQEYLRSIAIEERIDSTFNVAGVFFHEFVFAARFKQKNREPLAVDFEIDLLTIFRVNIKFYVSLLFLPLSFARSYPTSHRFERHITA